MFQFAHRLHRLFQIDGRHAHKPLRKLADKFGNRLMVDDPLSGPMPGTQQDAVHPRLVHQRDEVSWAEFLPEQMG